jgi:CMP-N,N'-diacetyllegionaminic acid synthase
VRTIASICARGGSKGLPGKNIRLFAGKPLIAHSIGQALACRSIEGVYVSTDDPQIAEIARREGAQVPFLRPPELASDAAAKLPVIEHLVAHLERAGERVERIVDLQPTSPLRTQGDLQAAIEAAAGKPLVVSVGEPSHNPYFTLVEQQPDGSLQLSKPSSHVRRQDLPPVWGLNGSIYVWDRAALARAAREGFWSVVAWPLVMPRERSVDIDDELDFEWAEWLYQRAQRRGETAA